jgi:hypothetical protein
MRVTNWLSRQDQDRTQGLENQWFTPGNNDCFMVFAELMFGPSGRNTWPFDRMATGECL